MTANLRIIAINEVDSATLSGSPALAATLPVTNLQDAARAKVARSTSLATQMIYGNFAGLKNISAMALVRHNFTAAATLRLKLYSELDQAGTLVYDSGVLALGDVSGWGESVWGVDPWGAELFLDWPVKWKDLFFTAVQAQSFSLQWDDPANTDTFMQAGRLFLGAAFEPSTNMSWGFKWGWKERTTQERTEGGSLRSDAGEPYRTVRLNLEFIPDGEREQLGDALRYIGLRRDFFFSGFPQAVGAKERDFAGSFKIVQMPDIEGVFAGNSRTELVMEEN